MVSQQFKGEKIDQNLVYQLTFFFLRVPFLLIKLVMYITYFWRSALGGTIRNIPSENDRKTNFRCSLNDEELDELCTQHRFESWSRRLKRVEVWQKPVSAVRFADFALTGFCQTSTLFNLSDHDSKRCWVDNESNSFIVERVWKWVFRHFHEGCFVCIATCGIGTKARVTTGWLVVGWSYDSDARDFSFTNVDAEHVS